MARRRPGPRRRRAGDGPGGADARLVAASPGAATGARVAFRQRQSASGRAARRAPRREATMTTLYLVTNDAGGLAGAPAAGRWRSGSPGARRGAGGRPAAAGGRRLRHVRAGALAQPRRRGDLGTGGRRHPHGEVRAVAISALERAGGAGRHLGRDRAERALPLRGRRGLLARDRALRDLPSAPTWRSRPAPGRTMSAGSRPTRTPPRGSSSASSWAA